MPTTTFPSKPPTFTIYGKPVTSSRPRFAVIRGRAMAYHAKPYKDWLAAAVKRLQEEWGTRPPISGPLHVDIDVCVRRPIKQTRAYPPFDLDNYAKGPLDALTKAGVWNDDEQVAELHVTKRYDTPERIDVTITPLALTIL